MFDVFYLFSSLMLYLVTIYDEYEFYEKQHIFKLDDYKQYSLFLNNFLYNVINNELIELKTIETNQYFSIFHQLISLLHDKDTKRSFTSVKDFWIIR